MNTETNIKTSALKGKSKDGKWTGIYISPIESDKTKELGQLFVLISLSAPSEFDSRVAGDLLSENIQDVFYESSREKRIINRIEKAILSTAKRLEYFLQREKIAAESGIDLNIEAVVTSREYIYMSILGEGSIMLWRENVLINLTEGLKDLTGRDLIKSGSGRFKLNDKFILFSPEATINVSEGEIKESIKRSNFDNIKNREENSLFGVLLIDIEEPFEKKQIPDDYAKAESEQTQRDIVKDNQDIHKEIEEKHDQKGSVFKNGVDKINEIKGKVKDKVSDKRTYQILFSRLKEYIKKTGVFLKQYVWNGILGLGGNGIYIRGAGPKRSIRGIVILIIIVVSILYLSIRSIDKHKEKKEDTTEIESILSIVDEKLINGRKLGEAGSIAEATKLIEEALSELNNAEKYGLMLDNIKQKQEEGIQILDEIGKVILLTDDNIITNIGGYIEQSTATDMVLLNSKLYITDSNASSLYVFNIGGGEVSKLFGDDSILSNPGSIAYDSKGDIFINDLNKGLIKYVVNENVLQELAGLSVTSLGDVSVIENYTTPDRTDYLYLLRQSSNDVRKITKFPSGYGSPELRLADAEINGAKDMEIDGKIYILTESNNIIRYFYDKKDAYTIIGLDKPISGATCLELDDSMVFIGDNDNHRVVILLKGTQLAPDQGKYVAQIIYRGDNDYLQDIKEIIVDNKARIMYILDGDQIFQVLLTKADEYAIDIK